MRMDQVQTHQNQEKMLQSRNDVPTILNTKTLKTDDHGKKKTSPSAKPGLNVSWLLQQKPLLDPSASNRAPSQQALGTVMEASR